METNRKDILKFRFYQALVDIVKLFGETEIGECEVDEEAAAQYVNSFQFVNDMWGVSSKEEFYQKITDDIINGFPVWQFLKVSDWTKQRLENTFARESEEKRRRLERTYKCFTCKYFKEYHTSLGTLYECTREASTDWIRGRQFSLKRRDKYIDPKKRCKWYERNI